MTSRSTDNRHVPGPWMHTDIMDGGRIFAADPNREGKRFRVCDIGPGYRSTADAYMAEANARLIAAAPELLESVRELKELFRFALLNTTPEIARDGMEFIRKAEAIITNATGAS